MNKPTSISVEEFRALKTKGMKVRLPGSSERAGKYNAKSVVLDGMRFDSKAEAGFELHLRLLKAQGLVMWWTRQVPFYLPSVTEQGQRTLKLVVDFLIVQPLIGEVGKDARGLIVRVVDVKGMRTRDSLNKKALVQARYGLHIEYVQAVSDGRYNWR